MKHGVMVLVVCFGLSAGLAPDAGAQAELVSAGKIWDEAPHNAFTSLARFGGEWFCTFREGDNHVGTDGRVRVIVSEDGATWESAVLLAEEGIDLRDPKLCVTPENRLMLVMGGSVYDGRTLVGRQPRVAFSSDGREWSAPARVLSDGHWLWRVTWHKGRAYGVSYARAMPETEGGAWQLHLVASDNGVDYSTVALLAVPDRPNETTLRFTEAGEMIALVRREAGTKHAWIGTSTPPYTEWSWKETGQQVGGPDFILLPDGRMVAGTRRYGGPDGSKTMLWRMTREGLEPLLELPSGGDTSYPGLVWHEGLLWVSYYASHEGKTSIYLAKVRLPEAG